MRIKRVEHIAIAVSSLGASVDLLRDTFGLTLAYEEQIGQTRLAMLPVGETYIELLEGQGPESGVTRWIGEIRAATRGPLDLHRIPRAGHWSAYENAPEINRLLLEFFTT